MNKDAETIKTGKWITSEIKKCSREKYEICGSLLRFILDFNRRIRIREANSSYTFHDTQQFAELYVDSKSDQLTLRLFINESDAARLGFEEHFSESQMDLFGNLEFKLQSFTDFENAQRPLCVAANQILET